MSGEFNLIEKYFENRQANRDDVLLSLGDDCALVKAPSDMEIAISTDTLVAGTHFLKSANPAWVAHKALASNISDLAAMGATPAWLSFALTMPEPDEEWLAPFCDAFFELANQYGIQLIGGDTTKGPLSLTLTVQGIVPSGLALKRSGASEGDTVWVSGYLGHAHAGLDVVLDEQHASKPNAQTLERLHYLSEPRVSLGESLRGVASAAIDISDGVASDLRHILARSKVGASIDVNKLPITNELISFVGSKSKAQQYALVSGEEYELCFTIPKDKLALFESKTKCLNVPLTCIGQLTDSDQLELHNNGQALDWRLSGYDHFKGSK